MNFLKLYYKIFLTYIFVVIFVFFWVYSVFSTDLFFDAQIISSDYLSKNFYLDDKNLNSNIIVFQSNNDLSWYNLYSSCINKNNFVWKKDDKYFFKIKILDHNCKSKLVFLKKEWKFIKKSLLNFNMFSEKELFDFYVFQTDLELNKILNNIKNLKKQNSQVNDKNIFKKFKIKRMFFELEYQEKIIAKILHFRKEKFSSPVVGYKISDKKNKIPNAGRPYRASYTDWIHHGWDVMAPLGTKVQSLAYGKIIRIVRNFKFSDLNKIKRTNLDFDQKAINLDILRWNQVWLQTARWDVIFYAHLRNIPENLKVGQIVEPWTIFGEIWISWVPDKHYKDYHLHFAVMKNPFDNKKKHSFLDYMKWDWYFKWKSLEYVLEHQNNIFKN